MNNLVFIVKQTIIHGLVCLQNYSEKNESTILL